MLDTPRVLVDRQPVFGAPVEHAAVIIRTGITRVIPGRFDESIEGVRFTLGSLATGRARGLIELRHGLERRSLARNLHIFRQDDGQLVLGNRHGTAGIAVNDRYRRSPVTLPRHAPVTETIVDGSAALAFPFKAIRNGVKGLLEIEAIVFAGIDQHAVVRVGTRVHIDFAAVSRGDHLHDGQTMLPGKLPVTVIVPGHCHHGAGAITHQDEIRDPQRHLFAADRVNCRNAQRHAFLFHRFEGGFRGLGLPALCQKGRQLRIPRSSLDRQRMLGGNRHIGYAHQGVGPRRKHGQWLGLTGDLERQLNALGTSDPVALLRLDRIRPARQLVEMLEQFISVRRYFHEPLRNLAPLDQRPGAPAAAVDHLLIGKDGLIDRIPVDHRVLAIDEALLEQLGEQPLLPAVVLRTTGGQFTRPVIAITEALQLAAHIVDILVGPFCRRHASLNGRVFRRHAECIPAHRLQHMPALHALVTRDDITDREYSNVPHVQLAAGIGKHRQAIKFFPGGVLTNFKGMVRFPLILGSLFNEFRAIYCVHRYFLLSRV